MEDSTEFAPAHPLMLKAVLALGGVFIVILIGARLSGLGVFMQATLNRVPFVLVEPGVLADGVSVLALALAPIVLLFPRPWRLRAGMVLLLCALAAFAISGNMTARGGPGISGTPLGALLRARGYARCSAGDRVRGSGRATRGEYVAEAWALPGACPAAVPHR